MFSLLTLWSKQHFCLTLCSGILSLNEGAATALSMAKQHSLSHNKERHSRDDEWHSDLTSGILTIENAMSSLDKTQKDFIG